MTKYSLVTAALFASTVIHAETVTRTRSFGAMGGSKIVPRMCRIQVTREGQAQQKNLDVGVTTIPSIYAGERRSESQAQVVSSIVVTSGLKARIDVDGEAVDVRCHALRDSFELDLIVSSRPAPRPVPPPFPQPGQPQLPPPPPAPQSLEGPVKTLATSITVGRGQRTEIGGIVRDMRNQGREISTGGFGYGIQDGNAGERVYLVVE